MCVMYYFVEPMHLLLRLPGSAGVQRPLAQQLEARDARAHVFPGDGRGDLRPPLPRRQRARERGQRAVQRGLLRRRPRGVGGGRVGSAPCCGESFAPLLTLLVGLAPPRGERECGGVRGRRAGVGAGGWISSVTVTGISCLESLALDSSLGLGSFIFALALPCFARLRRVARALRGARGLRFERGHEWGEKAVGYF